MCVYMRSGGYGTGSMQYQRWYSVVCLRQSQQALILVGAMLTINSILVLLLSNMLHCKRNQLRSGTLQSDQVDNPGRTPATRIRY